ncbi:MAG TPA: hypothetical protein VFB43_10530 [Terracidiphilus sp.]|nr:hypothetical protein [Terracidiphilus sp.]
MPAAAHASLSDVLWQFAMTLSLVGIPGILGGLTNSISMFLKPRLSEETEWASLDGLSKSIFFFAHAITGFGGSLAALLVILWANRFPKDLVDVEALLTLSCTGFVAGYIANKLLPAIADSLYKRLAKLAEQQDELKKETRAKIGSAVDLSTVLTRAKDYLSSGVFDSGETQKLIASLSELAKIYPTNRPLNILLSRTWEEAAHNRKKALEVLSTFIQAKLHAGERDGDLAAAYWNSANYHEFDFREKKNPTARKQAIECLRNALEIAPSYLQQLPGDEDLAPVANSEEGKAALKDVMTAKTA